MYTYAYNFGLFDCKLSHFVRVHLAKIVRLSFFFDRLPSGPVTLRVKFRHLTLRVKFRHLTLRVPTPGGVGKEKQLNLVEDVKIVT